MARHLHGAPRQPGRDPLARELAAHQQERIAPQHDRGDREHRGDAQDGDHDETLQPFHRGADQLSGGVCGAGSTGCKISAALKSSPKGATAILISARQSTEEIYLVSKLAKLLEARTDSLARIGEGDFLLLNPDMNPNSRAIQIFGLAAATPGASIPEIAQAIESGALRNLIAIGENPIEMGIEPGILSRLDLFVVCDILGNKSTLEAQYLLPGASFAEKQGTFINAKGRVQRFGKAFNPAGEARPEYWILSSLLSALTDQPWPETPEEIFNMMAAELPEFNGMTWAKLGTAGMNLLSTTNPTKK